MQKYQLKFYQFAVITAAIILLTGCANARDHKIYKEGRTWKFAVTSSQENALSDSCYVVLTSAKNTYINMMMGRAQTPLSYDYFGFPDSPYNEWSGILEDSTTVSIHPPRHLYLEFTEIPPMPSISLPPNLGTTTTSTLYVAYGFIESANGKRIRQKTKMSPHEDFQYKNKILSCWIIEGENTNHLEELGVYKSKHYFNEQFGFVKMEYTKPDGEKVTLSLVDTNFTLE